MKATIELSSMSYRGFVGVCSATISKVGWGTKKGTIAACKDILEISLAQVPRDTDTLASTAGYRLEGNWREGFRGVVGYALDSDTDAVNPKTGKAASSYVLAVHENLNVNHPIGNAKFLENAVREYAAEKFPRTVMQYVGNELKDVGGEVRG